MAPKRSRKAPAKFEPEVAEVKKRKTTPKKATATKKAAPKKAAPKAAAKKTKKEKKAGPKRASSAFILFSNAKRAQVKADNPEFKVTDVAREMGVLWKSATDEEKAPFVKEAEADKIRYQEEKAAFEAGQQK